LPTESQPPHRQVPPIPTSRPTPKIRGPARQPYGKGLIQ
jgi:hypothetical protein